MALEHIKILQLKERKKDLVRFWKCVATA